MLFLQCRWCPAVGRCSEGIDRHRQEWKDSGCDRKMLSNSSMCALFNETLILGKNSDTVYNGLSVSEDDDTISSGQLVYRKVHNANVSGIVAIVFLIGMACGLSLWVFYAYRNPHTTSGQILIRVSRLQDALFLSSISCDRFFFVWRTAKARYLCA